MAYTTTPRTWVSGELVTALIMNTHVRDSFNDILDSNGDFVGVASGDQVFLDAGGDTYIYEKSANLIAFVAGGAEAISFAVDGTRLVVLPTTGSAANLVCSAAGALVQRSTSSVRYKQDVQDVTLADARKVVEGLRPITYRGKTDEDKRPWYGFLAEEVATLDPRLVQWSEQEMEGDPEYVTYDRVAAPLVLVVRDLLNRIGQLESRKGG